jgi:integrase
MTRPSNKLSVKKIATKIKEGPGRYSDGDGLSLQITKPAKKGKGGNVASWLFRYVLRGRERWMGLGALRHVSLAEARSKADAARKLLEQGIDPLDAAEAERAAQKAKRDADAVEAARRVTFADAARKYKATKEKEWTNAKHANQFLSTLQTYAFPIIGSLPVSMIDTPWVLKVLEPIWETKTVTANRVRSRIELVLGWATASGFRTGENPARWKAHLATLLAKKSKIAPVTHHKAMAYDDVPAFVAELTNQIGVAPRALEFLILTAARSGEVIGARRDEFELRAAPVKTLDKDGREITVMGPFWTVPAGRIKGRAMHRVPLVGRAVAILKSLDRAADRSPRSEHNGELIFDVGDDKALLELVPDDNTVHGFRTSFRTWAAECTNFPTELAKVAIAHKVGDDTEQAYQRSDLLEKRRKLMEAWAAFCTTPRRDATVIPISSKRVSRKRGS